MTKTEKGQQTNRVFFSKRYTEHNIENSRSSTTNEECLMSVVITLGCVFVKFRAEL